MGWTARKTWSASRVLQRVSGTADLRRGVFLSSLRLPRPSAFPSNPLADLAKSSGAGVWFPGQRAFSLLHLCTSSCVSGPGLPPPGSLPRPLAGDPPFTPLVF